MPDIQPIVNSVVAAIVIAIISALGGWLFAKLKGFKNEHSSLVSIGDQFDSLVAEHAVASRAIRDMVRSSITRVCDEALKNGCIAENQLRNLCELYESYKALGGNSYVDELFNHTTQLPLAGSADPGIEYMKRYGLIDKLSLESNSAAVASTEEIVSSYNIQKGGN